MAFKQLAKIDNRTKFAVHGWIRQQEKFLKMNVPSTITEICILYYRSDEIVSIIGDKAKLSENKKTITAIDDSWWHENNFGINEVPSNVGGVYEWKLKIISDAGQTGIQFGITSMVETHERIWQGSYYLFCNGFKRNTHQWELGEALFKEGQQVSLFLDLNKAEIKMSVDGGDVIVVFKNVKKSNDIKYRLVISMYSKGNAIEIVSFSQR